jgi:hypothetical protein
MARTEGAARCLSPASKKLRHRDGLTYRGCCSACCTQIEADVAPIPASNQCGYKGLSLAGTTKNMVQVKATKGGLTITLCKSEPLLVNEDDKQLQVRLGRHTHVLHALSLVPTRFSAHRAVSLPTLATTHRRYSHETDYILDLT